MEPVIEAKGLGKTYRLYDSQYGRLLEMLPWDRKKRYREVHALQDVEFAVAPGECVGLVGTNGAGKSTLLKVLSGTTYPTSGSYAVRGRVTSLLELGAGFNTSFSGRENIFMNAAMLGFSRQEANRKYAEIVDFSELGEFINAPVRTYSSGMAARLAFSVAMATDPDLLIVDEILSVGDMNFQKKCFDRVWSFKKRGKAMFFCSHGLYQVRQICERAIWLRSGRMQMIGDAVTVTNEYATYENNLLAGGDPSPFADVPKAPAADDLPCIVGAEILDPVSGQPRNVFAPGENAAVRVRVRNPRRERLTVAVGAKRTDGTLCFAHTTQFAGVDVDFAEGHVTLLVDSLCLLSGEFGVPIWLFDENGVHLYQERPAAQNLIVQNRTKDLGLFLQAHRWAVEPITR
ncbi:MAG: ABC transporter ATP-binding protein [Planctomycetes bacterium]|nr:ABC transporter ATP-binding protein [Planctomycetota bacterium]